jgi:hypothetical protein
VIAFGEYAVAVIAAAFVGGGLLLLPLVVGGAIFGMRWPARTLVVVWCWMAAGLVAIAYVSELAGR